MSFLNYTFQATKYPTSVDLNLLCQREFCFSQPLQHRNIFIQDSNLLTYNLVFYAAHLLSTILFESEISAQCSALKILRQQNKKVVHMALMLNFFSRYFAQQK